MDAKKLIPVASALVLAACASASTPDARGPRDAEGLAEPRASFHPKGQAGLDRLEQDEVQKLCTEYSDGRAMPAQVARRIEQPQLATIHYPADGKLVGDWKAGEKIAQSGIGKQYSDDPSVVAGGNCY